MNTSYLSVELFFTVALEWPHFANFHMGLANTSFFDSKNNRTVSGSKFLYPKLHNTVQIVTKMILIAVLVCSVMCVSTWTSWLKPWSLVACIRLRVYLQGFDAIKSALKLPIIIILLLASSTSLSMMTENIWHAFHQITIYIWYEYLHYIIWNIPKKLVLRWSVIRRDSPWHRRASLHSTVAPSGCH